MALIANWTRVGRVRRPCVSISRAAKSILFRPGSFPSCGMSRNSSSPSDRGLPGNKLTEKGRVAQLAEQLTLNQ